MRFSGARAPKAACCGSCMNVYQGREEKKCSGRVSQEDAAGLFFLRDPRRSEYQLLHNISENYEKQRA